MKRKDSVLQRRILVHPFIAYIALPPVCIMWHLIATGEYAMHYEL
jgi:hypothetical protein